LMDLSKANEHETLPSQTRESHVIEHRKTKLTSRIAFEHGAHDIAAAMHVAKHKHAKVTSHDRCRLQLRDGELFAAIAHPHDINKHAV